MPDLMADLTKVLQTVFEDDNLQVSENTTAADIPGWDSLMHVRVMLNVERAFGIRFKTAEIAKPKNIGELAQLVEHYVSEKMRKKVA